MSDEKPKKERIPKPTKEQINEVTNPALSRDFFKIGDKEIPIQILPIDDEERIIGIFFPAIKEFMSGMPEKVTAKEIFSSIDPSQISKYSGLLKEIILIMAKRHDPEITKEYVGQNIHTKAIIDAILKQLEKNQIADMVTSFFFKMARMLPKTEEKDPLSPQS